MSAVSRMTASFEQEANKGTTKMLEAYTAVQINPIRKAVWLPKGVRLDLGGIGKGYTAETVVNFMRAWGPCLVDAGGDLTAGNAPADMPGWPVGISSPYVGLEERPDTSPFMARKPNLSNLWHRLSALATEWHTATPHHRSHCQRLCPYRFTDGLCSI